MSEDKGMHLIQGRTISCGERVQDILFANLLDTPDAKEFLVSRCESQHEIHIYAKRVARLGLVLFRVIPLYCGRFGNFVHGNPA